MIAQSMVRWFGDSPTSSRLPLVAGGSLAAQASITNWKIGQGGEPAPDVHGRFIGPIRITDAFGGVERGLTTGTRMRETDANHP
jgi:hypothetical protein